MERKIIIKLDSSQREPRTWVSRMLHCELLLRGEEDPCLLSDAP
jgi:hypothetical protein